MLEPVFVFGCLDQGEAHGTGGAAPRRSGAIAELGRWLLAGSTVGELGRQAATDPPLEFTLDLVEVHRQAGVLLAELSQLLEVVADHPQLGDAAIEIVALIQHQEGLVDGVTEQQCPINRQPLSR